MYPILKAEKLADKIYLMVVEAPRVARACEPGEFVIVKMGEEGERIPLTSCDFDRQAGTITIVFQTVGASTEKMSTLKAGDAFHDFVGPLGNPSEFIHEDVEELKKKKYLFVAGGVGAAPVYPQVKWMHEHGIDVDVIVGSKTKDLLILTEEMEKAAGNLYITTDDGSFGIKGMVTGVIEDLVEKQGRKYDVCVAIGMCGACRVTVGDQVKFACVDGPEFDGHLVNFDEAMERQRIYKTQEGRAMLRLKEGDTHHGGCGQCGGDK